MSKKIIFYIILIIVILVFVFFSQQVYSNKIGNEIVQIMTQKATGFIAKGTGASVSGFFSKIGQEAQNRGEGVIDAANEVKENISDQIKKVENYFSGISNAIQGKTNTCVK
jgi:peptidoglycan hydrolase CwlO-like protein